MKRFMTALVALFVLAGCGKNDGYNPYGYNPYPYNNNYTTVPTPPTGGYPTSNYTNPWGNYYPTGGYPQIGYPYNYTGNTFQPSQYPYGYNSQYTPWMPLHQWMQQNPYRYQYYQAMLNNWYYYAQYRGYSRYNFNAFWLDYCRNTWSGTQLQPLYDYYTINVYPWVNYQTSYPQSYNPSQYWGSYSGFPYGYLDTMYPSSFNWSYYW